MSLLTNVVNTINNTVSSSITEGSNFVNQLLATDMPPPPPPRTNPTQIMQIRALFADLIEAADPKHPHAANTIRSVLAKHIETITLLQQDFTLLKKAGIPLSQETANAIQQKFNMAGLFGIQINRSNIDRYLSNEEALRIAVDAQESVKNYDFSDVVFHLCNYFSSLFHSDTSELAQFFQKIVKNYYSSQLYEDRKTLMIHLLRETSPNTDDMTKISLLVHHSGPYFLKLLQTVVDKLKGSTDPKVVTFIRIMESVKSSLPPIPQEEVDLQMEKIRKESPFSVQILKSLGAATMGETFLLSCDDPCNATSFYAVMKLKRPNIKEKVQREEFIFEREAAGNPGMEKFIHSFKSTMAEDLDFRNEAKNVQKARSYFGSGRVGTVEFLDVMPVSDDYFFMELAPGHDLDHWLRHIDTMPSSERFAKLRLLTVLNKSVQSLVEKWIEVLLFSSHHEGLLHKDPHAGNIIIEIPFLTSPDKLEHGETYVRFIDW